MAERSAARASVGGGDIEMSAAGPATSTAAASTLPPLNAPQDRPDLDEFLAGLPFFAALGQDTRRELARQLEPVHAAAGDVIFRQGDLADGLFILVSGRLRVSMAGDGPERTVYDLGRGGIVGEMALLTDRPRSATVHAARDSDLLLLRVPSFTSLVERSPALVAGMIRLIADRLLAVNELMLANRVRSPRPGARTIAVAAAGQRTGPAALVAEQLAAQLARSGSVSRVDAEVVARQLGPDAAQRGPGAPGRAELTGWLHAVERDHDRVIYQTDAAETAWSRLCLSQSDVVLLVASADDDPSLGAVEARALATESLRCELALLHSAQPSGTARWLHDRPVADFHHLRAGRTADVARLARMVTGTACGLVLGGGGARGLAHLGVLQALEEAGVPIDVVGGTSMGAIMAGLYALGIDHTERVRIVGGIARNGRRLVTPTLPLIALSSGRYVDRVLADNLGSGSIEDMPRRFFCVSANLTRAEEVIHERGPAWLAVRASLALPGIFPPVYAGGDLLIDGGTLDNVPVDVMRDRIGEGSIVAVDVSPEVEALAVTPFAAGLSGWRVLGHRLQPFAARQMLPGIADILSRSTGLSQVRHRRTALGDDHIDLLLRPPVARLRSLDFRGGVQLIETAYRYAAEALEKSGLAGRFVT
jgi:predicted acylesterase/phospholipase RssA/CRP-like cAMP-binding protein